MSIMAHIELAVDLFAYDIPAELCGRQHQMAAALYL